MSDHFVWLIYSISFDSNHVTQGSLESHKQIMSADCTNLIFQKQTLGHFFEPQ